MPYRVDPKNKKCVQVKKSGKWQRKGCTDGPVKNYLAALYANTKDIKESEEFDWAKDIVENFSTKFSFIRTLLKKGDKFLLTGDLKDSNGDTMLYLDKEPFIVTSKINEYELNATWVRPNHQRPDGWEEVTNLANDAIYFHISTKKLDDELEVDFLDDKNINESEGEFDWAQDIISQPLNLKRKVLYFDNGLTYYQWRELKKFFKENGVTYFTGDPIDVISNNVIKSKHIIFNIDDDNTVMWNDVDASINQEGSFYKILKDGKSDLSFNDVKEKIGDLFVKFNVMFLNGYDFIGGKYSGHLYERKEEKSESEEFDWAFDMVQKIESNLDVLVFKGKEVMIDVRDMTYQEKENLLKIIEPYFSEKTKERLKTSSPMSNDWSPKCLLYRANIATLSLHCGTEETEYIPEEGNVCCLSTTYEEEELTPKELLVPVNGKFLLKVSLNENEEWWTDTVSSFGTTESDGYYNEISNLLEGTPYEIVVEKSVSGGKLFKIKHRDRVLSVEVWNEKFFKPKYIREDIISQISYFDSNSIMYETLNDLYVLLIPFFRKHGLKPDTLDESEEFDWAKDLVSGISKDMSTTGKIKVTIDNWVKFRNTPVVRGPNWEWGNQDSRSYGYIEDFAINETGDNWVHVIWLSGDDNNYRIGPRHYDLYFDFNINESKNLLKEGKYDKITGTAVKDIMRILKQLEEGPKDEDEYYFSLPSDSETENSDEYYQEGLQFSVDLRVFYHDDLIDDFEVRSSTAEEEENIIIVQIIINKRAGKNVLNEILYKLNEDIRHEIEHFTQEGPNVMVGKPKPKHFTKFKTTFKHHKNPAEISALVRGFYRRAKTEKKPLDVVMIEDLEREMAKGNIDKKEKEKLLKIWIEYAKKNLPAAIYKFF